MASDTSTFLRELEKRGYRLQSGGNKHVQVWQGRQLVTVASLTPRGGHRSLQNLKAQVRRFERENPPGQPGKGRQLP